MSSPLEEIKQLIQNVDYLEFRVSLARALHANYCETKSINVRDRQSIDTSWAADGKNRGLWVDEAHGVCKWLVAFLGELKS